jgi:lysophospholipase L1-like esterase
MNINPSSKRILCYGDSNTWGYIPGTGKRHPAGIRWTSLLQDKLGNNFELIEEGLNSRTTDLDDPKHQGKNGLTYFRPCLETHDPVDILILWLGTNDMKERFNRDPQRIADGIKNLLDALIEFSKEEETKLPKLVLVSPPLIDESAPGVKDEYLGGEQKSRQLAELYAVVAHQYDCVFVDISKLVSPSKIDGYHLKPKQHQIIADHFFSIISSNSL